MAILETLSTGQEFSYTKLTPEEMQKRGILGRITGPIADFTNPTRNGRRYGEKLWDTVFSDPLFQEKIDNKCVFGELGHPADRQETDMSKICCCLAEIPKKKDGMLYGVFDILNTPNGNILKSMLDYGVTVGVSSRGSGDLITDFDGQEAVDPDSYQCEGWDIVILPAVRAARMKSVMESLESKPDLNTYLAESIKKIDEKDRQVVKESLNALGILLNEDLFTEESSEEPVDILNLVCEEFGTVDKPYFGPTFIMPNGLMLDLSYQGAKHSDVEKFLIEKGLSQNNYSTGAGSKTLFDLGCIRCDMLKYYMGLPDAQLTGEQYNTLLYWLDEFFRTTSRIEVITPDNQNVTYSKKDYISDDVVKRIKRYYSTGKLVEEFDTRTRDDYTFNRNPIGESFSINEESSEDGINAEISDNNTPNEPIENTSESAVDNNEAVVEELQEALKLNRTLDSKVVSLNEKLSVSYAKEMKLEEEVATLREQLARLQKKTNEQSNLNEKLESMNEEFSNKEASLNESLQKTRAQRKALSERLDSETKRLTESIAQKDVQIQELNEKLSKASRVNSKNMAMIESLQDEVETTKKDNVLIKENYSKKLDKSNQLVEKYKGIAKNAVNKYIESQAIRLGVKPQEIKNRLPESYGFKDIDQICESLRKFQVNLNNLPFDGRLNEGIKVSAVNTNQPSILPQNKEDMINDFDLGLIKNFI